LRAEQAVEQRRLAGVGRAQDRDKAAALSHVPKVRFRDANLKLIPSSLRKAGSRAKDEPSPWIPAFAGMTMLFRFAMCQSDRRSRDFGGAFRGAGGGCRLQPFDRDLNRKVRRCAGPSVATVLYSGNGKPR